MHFPHATFWAMQKTQALVEDDLLVSREVLAIARISRRTLERWVKSGKLPVIRIDGFRDRRYRRSDIDAILPPSPIIRQASDKEAS